MSMSSSFNVISNSTPLILLQKIGYLKILKSLYSKIYIPQAVYNEVIVARADVIKNDFISENSWIEVVKVKDIQSKKLFKVNLHEGEVETIILCLEISANLCILDDLLARKYAKHIGIDVTGTLGVLVYAKNSGLISQVKPLLDKLLYVGMFIDKDLYSRILSLVNEK